jgi:hypothetical protein
MGVFYRGRQTGMAMRVMTVIVAVVVGMGKWRMQVRVRMAFKEQQRDASPKQQRSKNMYRVYGFTEYNR